MDVVGKTELYPSPLFPIYFLRFKINLDRLLLDFYPVGIYCGVNTVFFFLLNTAVISNNIIDS